MPLRRPAGALTTTPPALPAELAEAEGVASFAESLRCQEGGGAGLAPEVEQTDRFDYSRDRRALQNRRFRGLGPQAKG